MSEILSSIKRQASKIPRPCLVLHEELLSQKNSADFLKTIVFLSLLMVPSSGNAGCHILEMISGDLNKAGSGKIHRRLESNLFGMYSKYVHKSKYNFNVEISENNFSKKLFMIRLLSPQKQNKFSLSFQIFINATV